MLAFLLFAKYPEPGRVKTRIAATLGPVRAAEIYRDLVARVIASLPPDCPVIVAYDPPELGAVTERWLGPHFQGRSVTFQPQVDGDLGARLDAAFRWAFAAGHDAVAAIGGDCVEMSADTFAELERAWAASDCVIGPARDGGYYLIALRRPCREIFAGIAWSTGAVVAETLARARAAGLRVHLLPELGDVDTEEDWRKLGS